MKGRILLLTAVLALALLLVPGDRLLPPASANTGCPESTDSFGTSESSGCTISTSTTWGNGTLYMTAGADITLNAPLTLWNMDVRFNHTVDRTSALYAYADFTTRAGTTITGNPEDPTIRWDLATSGDEDAIDLQDSVFANGIYDLGNAATATVEGNTFRDTDMTDNNQHMWIGPNSTVRHNTFDAIDTTQSAVLVSNQNWGETLIWGNSVNFTCSGNNCMGIEILNIHDAQVPIYPGFPTFEVAWNNVTLTSVTAGTDSAAYDFEYAKRLYVHNNTASIVHAGQADTYTEMILSGGTIDSVYENNTGYGKPESGAVYTYCFYEFIYSTANALWQYNSCDDVERMAIISGSGENTFRHNTMTNVSSAGFWYCDTCGGGSAGSRDNVLFNNTFTFTLSTADLVWIDTTILDYNTFILNGDGTTNHWGEGPGGADHTVPGAGSFLYKAEDSIERLIFANETDGDRRVTMYADGGGPYWSTYPAFGATDDASLSITGSIGKYGSLNQNDDEVGTFLWQLSRASTQVDVQGTGQMDFDVTSFYADTQYNVSVWNYSDASWENTSFTTDLNGDGSFSIGFAARYNITIGGEGEAPGGGGGGGGDIAVDSVSADTVTNAASTTFSHTIAGTNRLLVVGLSWWDSPADVSDVKLGDTALAEVWNETPGTTSAAQYYLLNPPNGTQTVAVNWTAATWAVVGAISFTGVNQTDPLGSNATNAGTGSPATVDVTSASGELVVDTVATNDASSKTVGAGQTERWNLQETGVDGGGSTENGSATVTMSWALSGSPGGWRIGATALRPAEAAWSNTAPSIDQSYTNREGGHNISYSEALTSTDADANQTLSWSLATNLSSLALASSDRSAWVNGTPTFAERDGTYYVNVSVWDAGCGGGCNLSDSLNYTLWLNNSAPTITDKIASDTATLDAPYAEDFTSADANSDGVTWAISDNASFTLSVDATGTVSGTPNATGQFWVNVTLVDYSSDGDYVNYTLTVSAAGGDGGGNGGGGGGGGGGGTGETTPEEDVPQEPLVSLDNPWLWAVLGGLALVLVTVFSIAAGEGRRG